MKIVFRVAAVVGALLVSAPGFAQKLELVLKDKLDGDLNGYCFDIMGGGENIDPSQGLQAHTCYSYRGEIGTDQAVDTSSLGKGKILLIDFDVCATLATHEVGAALDLERCNGTDSQEFVFTETGTISPASAPGMCLAAGKETAFGRNGTSPHQIKTLSLQVCSDEEAAYQQWFTLTLEEYNAEHGN